MPSLDLKPWILSAVLAGQAAGLGGCSTAASFSYGEYQAGPGYQSERVYEHHLYGDTTRGVGSRTCREEARRSADAAGMVSGQERRVCDNF